MAIIQLPARAAWIARSGAGGAGADAEAAAMALALCQRPLSLWRGGPRLATEKSPDYDAARGILYCIHFQGLILKVFKVSQKVLWPPRALGTMYVYICDSVIFCMALFSRFSGSWSWWLQGKLNKSTGLQPAQACPQNLNRRCHQSSHSCPISSISRSYLALLGNIAAWYNTTVNSLLLNLQSTAGFLLSCGSSMLAAMT